jgi:hypothetical protein
MVVQAIKQKVYTHLTAAVKSFLTVWGWIKSWFIGKRYTIIVSYDSKFGNLDDKSFAGVRKIKKSNWKELSFITAAGKLVTVRSVSGLLYRIEEE